MEIDKQTFFPGSKIPILCDRCGITVAWSRYSDDRTPVLICNLCMHDESHVATTLGILNHAQNGMPLHTPEHNDALAERIRASNNVSTNLNNFIISLHNG